MPWSPKAASSCLTLWPFSSPSCPCSSTSSSATAKGHLMHAHAHTHTTLLPRTNIPIPLPPGRGLDGGTCTSSSVRVRWDACWGELHSRVGHTPLLTPPLSQWQYQVYRHPWNGVPGVCGPGGPVPAGGRQVCASARVPRPLPAEGLRSGGGPATDEHHALLRSLFSDDASRHP